MFKTILSPKAARQFKSLEKRTLERIKAAIEKNLLKFPPSGDILKLEGKENIYRLRVGDWRVTFRYQFDRGEVHIAEIVHRSKAYRK